MGLNAIRDTDGLTANRGSFRFTSDGLSGAMPPRSPGPTPRTLIRISSSAGELTTKNHNANAAMEVTDASKERSAAGEGDEITMKRPPDGPSKTKEEEEEEEREHPAIAQVRCMMGRELRIRIVDGRVFTGRFECYDKQGNILMDNAMSTSVGDPEGTEPHVFRGMIVIQAQHRVDTHLVVRDGEVDPSAPDFDPYKELEERSLFEMAQAETYADGGVDPVDGHDPPVL